MEHKNHQDLSIGVVGGGQLAQMMSEAANSLGVKVIVQTGSKLDPAAINANRVVLSDTKDIKGTMELAQQTKTITFENEWIDVEALSLLEDSGVSFVPKLSSMAPLVNKHSQRKLLNKLDIPGPQWISLSSLKVTDLKLPDKFKFPLMAKCSFGGYDGKGTRVINDFNDLKKLQTTVDTSLWFLENWVDYEKELSMVVSRDHSGIVRFFPFSETFQSNQICNWVFAPADVTHTVKAMATNIASSLVRELNYVGVMAIEFFYGKDGLLVNEIAPRTHNSAHLSIEACKSSQFEHQVAIATGLNVESSELSFPGAMMVNLLGFKQKNDSIETRLKKLREIPGVNIHWYQKDKNLPGRKLGHITKLLDSTDSMIRKELAIQILNQIRAIWPID